MITPSITLVRKVLTIAIAAGGLLSAAGRAQNLQLPFIPAALSDQQRADFQHTHDDLEQRWAAFLQAKAAFVSAYAGTLEGTPRAAEAEHRKAELKAQADAIVDATDELTSAIEEALEQRIGSLTAQIQETETQLRGLGFKQRAEDFERIGEVSREASGRLVAKLFQRVQDLVTDKTEEAMQDRFLEAIKNLKPKQAQAMLAAMEKAGVSDPLFLEWLRSFKPNKPRAEVVADAKVVIKFLKQEQDLGEFFEKLEPGTVDAQQEAALTLVSLVIDHPYLSELKAVAAGTYDVSEAWFFIAVLDLNEQELAAVTDQQLSAQKVLIKRMETLVKTRTQARSDLRKLNEL
ncbi:MAG: hypothetical protein WC485_02195 [Opitutaceae bacterium]